MEGECFHQMAEVELRAETPFRVAGGDIDPGGLLYLRLVGLVVGGGGGTKCFGSLMPG